MPQNLRICLRQEFTVTEDAIQTARELATHASDIRHLQDDMDKMLESMKIMQATLTAIDKTLSEAKGGWKMLMWVGILYKQLLIEDIKIYITHPKPKHIHQINGQDAQRI